MKEDFVTKETTRIAAIAELERVIRQMREESIKVNVNLETQEKAIQVYLDQMERHQTPTKLPHPFFSYPTLLHLQTQITEFGEVREWELDYSLKKQPVLAVGKKGTANNELNWPRGLALYEPNQLIYIADCYNSRIQVVSFAGKFLKMFGQGILMSPYGIAVTEDNLFVTDIYFHALLQFGKKDYKLVRRTCTHGQWRIQESLVGGDINPAGGLGGAVSPQWGPGAKPLATKLNAISCVFYYVITD